MAKNETISISFKVLDGADGLKTLTVDAKNLEVALKSTVKAADNLKTPFINFAASTTSIEAVQNVIQNFQSALKGLTDAYSIQIEAETRLATNMRNTMSATESEIQRIKDLCAAQQELGVIGDEIQLAGAQELATYLTKKKSLEQLIPVMNDMIAQQYGYSATAESAANIATMLGKVMDGQVGALSRYGYKFDEAQAQILKFGDEQERVAVLAEVIESSVGGSNKALANTPFGPIKQLSNSLGDVKEQLGAVAVKIQPALDWAASITISIGGISKLIGGVSALNIALKAAGRSAKILGLALKSILITSGVGLAIWALVEAIDYLTNSEDEAAKKTKALAEEQARYATEVRDISEKVGRYSDAEINRLDRLYKAATDENKSKKERIKAARELQNIYPAYFSNMSAEDIALGKAKKSYDDLTDSILKNARVKAAAEKIVENEAQANSHKRTADNSLSEVENILAQKRKLKKRIEAEFKKARPGMSDNQIESYSKSILLGTRMSAKSEFKEINRLADEAAELNGAYSRLSEVYTNALREQQELLKANEDLKADYGVTDADLNSVAAGRPISFLPEATEITTHKSRLEEINDEILKLRDAYITASASERLAILEKVAALDAEKTKIEELLKTFDERRTFDFTVNISNAEFEVLEGGLDGLTDRLHTIRDISEAIDVLKQKQQDASAEEIAQYQESINLLEDKLGGLEKLTKRAAAPFNASASNLKDIANNIDILNEKLQTASIEEAAVLNQEIAMWNKKADAIRNAGSAGESTFTTFRKGWSAVESMAGAIENVNNALDSDANAWAKTAAVVDASLHVYDGIMAVIDIVRTLLSFTQGQEAAEIAKSTATTVSTTATVANAVAEETAAAAILPVIAANKAATASYMELAAAAYFAAHAYIPFWGFGIASGFVTAATSIVETIGAMPFANGGIVSGPTVGLIGEYAGASNNPEVVAPLDKLRSLITPAAGIDAGKVEFVIDGRVLRGVLRRVDNLSNRT